MHFVVDYTSMHSVKAIDALVRAGYDDRAVRMIAARYTHWGAFVGESTERRMLAAGSTLRTSLPEQCPPLRGPSFGRLCSAFDATWPRQLELPEQPPVLIEIAGTAPTDAVAIIGATYPSMLAIEAARRVAQDAGRAGMVVVAVDVGVGHHALHAARAARCESFVIMYGDDAGVAGRELLGGVRTRFEQRTADGRVHAGVHVRGSDHGTAGLVAGLEIAVALAHTVYIIEPGVGRVHGGVMMGSARKMGKRVVVIGGDEHRAERCSVGQAPVRLTSAR